MFLNRYDAGKQLAEKLRVYAGVQSVVVALPRGGVVVGYEIARSLGCPLDIVVTRKVGYPGNPEYAILAVDSEGSVLTNITETERVDRAWLERETEKQREEAVRRIKVFRGNRLPVSLSGKTVILVDDGVATGLTIRLAIRTVKKEKPARIVVAVPVCPPDVAALLKKEADEFLVLEDPREFSGSVGAHYKAFEQVEDDEVIRLLHS
ncbi:hypothetical protein A2841_03490 [Candidatus Kaiserbacteria bacterium RIFCSPHIGHO2_01_FULL_48_10]|uniref:Phosphoribosyltransferase domain-containing protein n=1 Tax=Candidatus Kaiserbacteria bacterium RIFCSPHIGHO2_01_FULL_48_10 TaxID=1798476 RepID=A0A1F6C1Y1_9BACT|nr:MAG: hypothetical protein A2841_03490 [Candidatus Kaiserbacteria bacterium RIFCSPHIGHO2_01_FULL_48_10]